MKQEERQQLEQNDLVSWAYRVPILLRKYGSHILLVIALALLGWQLWRYYQGLQEAKMQEAWSQLSMASDANNDPVRLRRVIDTYDVPPVQALAYVNLGNHYMEVVNRGAALGAEASPVTPDKALDEAEAAYQKVLTDYAGQELAIYGARLGLGRVYETRGQMDKARQQYEALANPASAATKTAFAEEARRRMGKLADWAEPVPFVVTSETQPASAPATGTATAPASAPAGR